jgi:hypothetical protein
MAAAETCQHGDSMSFAINPLPLMQEDGMSTALPESALDVWHQLFLTIPSSKCRFIAPID